MEDNTPKDTTQQRTNQHTLEVFTEDEAAEILRISKVTLWRERKRGRISFRRSASRPVYLREDLDDYLRRVG
jgi:hypothetical protein